MAVTVIKSSTKVNMKYPGDSKKGLSNYTLGIEVKNGASDESYYSFAEAIIPMVDADSRACESVTLTVAETIE